MMSIFVMGGANIAAAASYTYTGEYHEPWGGTWTEFEFALTTDIDGKITRLTGEVTLAPPGTTWTTSSGWVNVMTDMDISEGEVWVNAAGELKWKSSTLWKFSTADGSHMTIDPGHFTYTSVPIPGAVWLLGSGLIGLVGAQAEV